MGKNVSCQGMERVRDSNPTDPQEKSTIPHRVCCVYSSSVTHYVTVNHWVRVVTSDLRAKLTIFVEASRNEENV